MLFKTELEMSSPGGHLAPLLGASLGPAFHAQGWGQKRPYPKATDPKASSLTHDVGETTQDLPSGRGGQLSGVHSSPCM